MRALAVLGLSMAAGFSVCAAADPTAPVQLITLDPGHFHAALVQKFMYEGVDPLVHIYAPEGEDLQEHRMRIEAFNTRAEQPTRWKLEPHTGPDFLEQMLAQRPGNVVVISGNNARKTEYIARSVAAGLNVLADKPMVITPAELPRLEEAFATAREKGVQLLDIMTERFEITTILQRELSRRPALFGTLLPGSAAEPSITKESVHHFFKTVAGVPLRRPQWFFDVRQQGEGIVDVTTHLVDLIQWEAFPDQALSPADVRILSARRWPTPLTREQFSQVTGAADFPDFLRKDVKNGVLQVFSNGEFTYRLRGIHARVSVSWAFAAPPGGNDTHYSVMRGSKAALIIKQGAEQQFRPTLYVKRNPDTPPAEHEQALRASIAELQAEYPGVALARDGDAWRVDVPDKYHIGHEAHFAQVTQNFLRYVRTGRMPDWEVPNMLTRYATIMQAYERSRP